jgi:preprotein translocase subunit SecD
MNKNIRWKLLTIAGVFVLFFGVGVYPILASAFNLPIPAWLAAKQLRLGLDLKGGVHLVLRVQTVEALQIATTTTSEQVREDLRTAGVTVGNINVASATAFRVEGVPQDRDADFRRIADAQAAAMFDRSAGAGGTYDFVMKPNIAKDLTEQAVVQALETIERRVNELGVSEPNMSRYGQTGDQLLVQIPGVADVARAKETIRSTALLELKLVEAGPAESAEALLQPYGGKAPSDMEVVPGETATSTSGCGRHRASTAVSPTRGPSTARSRPRRWRTSR